MINQIKISDFQAPELDIYARTKEVVLLNRARPEEGIFIAESPKVIERALDSGCEPISILMEERHIEGEGKPVLERCKDIPVYTAEFDVLKELTGFPLTRGMLCAMHARHFQVCSRCVNMQPVSHSLRMSLTRRMWGQSSGLQQRLAWTQYC